MSRTSVLTAKTGDSNDSYMVIAANSRGELLADAGLGPVNSREDLMRTLNGPSLQGSPQISPRPSLDMIGSCDQPKPANQPYVAMELRKDGERRPFMAEQQRHVSDGNPNLSSQPLSVSAPFGDSTLRNLRERKPTLSEAKHSMAVAKTEVSFYSQAEQQADDDIPPIIPPREPNYDNISRSSDGAGAGGRESSLSNWTASLKSAHVPPSEFFDIEMQREFMHIFLIASFLPLTRS